MMKFNIIKNLIVTVFILSVLLTQIGKVLKLTAYFAHNYLSPKCRISRCISESAFYKMRFNSLRKYLPQTGTIGYLTDEGRVFIDNDAHNGYAVTRYALAPVMVAPDTNHELVIGNFKSLYHPGVDNVIKKEGLIPVKYFGYGVVLFKKGKK